MSKIIAIEHLSLDGVMQAPGRADEDIRNGFKYGGWANATFDPEMQPYIGKHMSKGWSLLSGRTTYDDFYESWHIRQPENPMAQALLKVQKFVTSYDPQLQLPWENSTLLSGEAAITVAKLKENHDKTIIIFGSGQLIRSLMPVDLIDKYVLFIHPLILGNGFRLFDNDIPYTKLSLTDSVTVSTGVHISTYLPACQPSLMNT